MIGESEEGRRGVLEQGALGVPVRGRLRSIDHLTTRLSRRRATTMAVDDTVGADSDGSHRNQMGPAAYRGSESNRPRQ